MKPPDHPLTEADLEKLAKEDFNRHAAAEGIVFIEGDDFEVDSDFDDLDCYAR